MGSSNISSILFSSFSLAKYILLLILKKLQKKIETKNKIPIVAVPAVAVLGSILVVVVGLGTPNRDSNMMGDQWDILQYSKLYIIIMNSMSDAMRNKSSGVKRVESN